MNHLHAWIQIYFISGTLRGFESYLMLVMSALSLKRGSCGGTDVLRTTSDNVLTRESASAEDRTLPFTRMNKNDIYMNQDNLRLHHE